jgi:thioredoxin-like negative regulator of GroEL
VPQGAVLGALAALVVVLVLGGRFLARLRLASLRELTAEARWTALGSRPDGRPVVVAFSTPACAACRTAQRPALAALAERFAGEARIVHVDVADRPDVARVFGVMTVPATVVMDAQGAVLAANQGFATTERLAEQVGGGLRTGPA